MIEVSHLTHFLESITLNDHTDLIGLIDLSGLFKQILSAKLTCESITKLSAAKN